ncbi:TlyA family rRNA (cytidine-2'-O)-methyltransferase [Boudabousia tangfeifanii]|uniref:TlyA family rRNA (Cytidine-2'-O)-methyltransferase n=1 Tax=Boudabousia tangfeifanii TaxID=1912795 RepID=A0A1D9MKR2_9ACTO|nr:TlyA family RNA methyltransferase [Boudabousia tangfeifanii]AOZ72818.1 TlyA family rRNA (cytidine-2'-O)-methyltransferase [Boudabousia tangfeifanii]
MAKLIRLDQELVRRKLARSRTQAQEMIIKGYVKVSGNEVTKPARQINPAEPIVVTMDQEIAYVSRGAHKLRGALDYLAEKAPTVSQRICLDAGASTGGFTDVLLRQDARKVYAADVGYGQLAWKLQSDARVEIHDRTNVRNLTIDSFEIPPTLVVSDLSFISLTTVLPALVACAAVNAEYLLMVKPQFEVGKDRLGAGGVVRDTALHESSILKVCHCGQELGLKVHAVAPSPLPGPAGNVEYFIHFSKGEMPSQVSTELTGQELVDAVKTAVVNGPAGKESKEN